MAAWRMTSRRLGQREDLPGLLRDLGGGQGRRGAARIGDRGATQGVARHQAEPQGQEAREEDLRHGAAVYGPRGSGQERCASGPVGTQQPQIPTEKGTRCSSTSLEWLTISLRWKGWAERTPHVNPNQEDP